MNFFLIVVFLLCTVSIHANYTIFRQIPYTNTSISPSTSQFIIQISQLVNRPSFQAFIHFNNATTNASISEIDVNSDTVDVTYVNNTLTFNTSGFNINDVFYITFDIGVLFSNTTINSTAITNPYFWYLNVIDIQTSTSVTNTIEYTSIGTTQYVTSGSSTGYSDTSGSTMIYTTVSQTTESLNTTSTSTVTVITGETPPTRSAQIGMGLGITFISLLIIIEIVYFKYCYSGSGRSDSYFT